MTSAISQRVQDFARSLPANARVIDVGCGLQPYRPFFSHTTYIGIDVESSGRTDDEKVADQWFDGTHIPFGDGSVDAILCTEVLEHAVDPETLVSEMYRVLNPGGRVCITVPFIWGLHELPYDFRRFTVNGLAKLVTDRGFVVDRQEKLVDGIEAVRMIIDSELNNYRVNVRPRRASSSGAESLRFRLAVHLHQRLMGLLMRLWRSHFEFERLYVDNHLVAHKPDHGR